MKISPWWISPDFIYVLILLILLIFLWASCDGEDWVAGILHEGFYSQFLPLHQFSYRAAMKLTTKGALLPAQYAL